MTLVDTSAWVEYLRGTKSAINLELRRLLASDAILHITDMVVMELLAGARDEAHAIELRRLLSVCEFVPTSGLRDFEDAAALYRTCRRSGETVRVLGDCLIAAIAIRADLDLLHADKDFEVLGRFTALRLH